MKLRGLMTGLAAAALMMTATSNPAGATTRIAAGGLDRVVLGSGQNALICSGGVVKSETVTTVTFPNSTRSLPAIEYTIDCSKILKGNKDYAASETPQTIKIKMYAGQMKDFPRPVVGQEFTGCFYGNSVVGLTSFAFGDEGLYIFKEVDGHKVAVSPAGKGLFFKNKNIEAKFMSSNPNAGKFLRKAPTGEEGLDTAAAASDEDVTPEVLESAVKTILTTKGE